MSTEPTLTPTVPTVDAIKSALDPVSIPAPGAEPKPDPALPPAAPADTPNDGPVDKTAEEPATEEKRKKASDRISELYGQKKAAERRAQSAVMEAQELRQELEQLRQSTNPDDYAQVQRNDTRAAVKEERLAQLQKEARAAVNDVAASRVEQFYEKLGSADKTRFDGFDDAIAKFESLPLSQDAAEIVAESAHAAAIAHHLGKNPDQAHKIFRMSPALQGAAIKEIEMKVSAGITPRKSSNAPPPVPMVRGSSAPAALAAADMGVEDIAKLLYRRS